MSKLLQPGITIVSGAVKSGKSLWAEKLVSESMEVTYIATYSKNIDDKAWQNRIYNHKNRRLFFQRLSGCVEHSSFLFICSRNFAVD